MYVVRLGTVTEAGVIGRKAATLSALAIAGFAVPDGIVLTTAAQRQLFTIAGLSGAETEREQLAAFEQCSWPAEWADEFEDAVAGLRPGPLAVRSSATCEDSNTRSFAGQFSSTLQASGYPAVRRAVAACLASGASGHVRAYLGDGAAGDGVGRIELAVLVQQMISATWSGVLFTADPITGDVSQLLMESVSGTPEALCAGLAQPHRCSLDKTTLAVRRHDPGPLPLREAGPDPRLLAEVAELGLRVEHELKCPVDIEWASDGARVYIIQARPITALQARPRSLPPASLVESLTML